MHIFHYLSKSYIKVRGKGKIYLMDYYDYLKEKIDSDEEFIIVMKSGLIDDRKISVKRTDITEYGYT